MGARCRTCASQGTNKGIKYVDEIIGDLDYAITHYADKQGFDKLVTEMAAQATKADGGAFLLQVLKSKGDDFIHKVQFRTGTPVWH